jgi:hypothetical protein
MDEMFRKPFEYEEEKRGLIILFIIMLIVIDTLQTFSFTTQLYEAYQNSALRTVFVILCILSILSMLFTAVNCSKMRKKMLPIAKLYLLIRVIYYVGCVILLYIYSVNHLHLIGEGEGRYSTEGQMIFGELVVPFAYILAFSIGWYLYFIKSKRCRELLKKSA